MLRQHDLARFDGFENRPAGRGLHAIAVQHPEVPTERNAGASVDRFELAVQRMDAARHARHLGEPGAKGPHRHEAHRSLAWSLSARGTRVVRGLEYPVIAQARTA